MKKRTCILIGMIAGMNILVGCTPSVKVNTSQLRQFEKHILMEVPDVKNLIVEYRPTNINFLYELKGSLVETDKEKLLTETLKIGNSESFYHEVIEGKYLKKYDELGIPKLMVTIDEYNDKVFDQMFTALPETKSIVPGQDLYKSLR